MTSSTEVLHSDADAMTKLHLISCQLTNAGFEVIRQKIECDISHEDVNRLIPGTYLESHLNIFIRKDQDIELLKAICQLQDVHLSRNINKSTKAGYTIMTTYRDSILLGDFTTRLTQIIKAIEDEYKIEKEIIEYALYDNNLNYDKTWLGDN